jgi:hypothetical protein
MVTLSIHFHKARFKVDAYILKDGPKLCDGSFVEDIATVFGNEDQMNMHIESTVSASTNFVGITHRPMLFHGENAATRGFQVQTETDP